MTDKDDKTSRDNPEQSEPLSATGLFLRAFEAAPEPPKQSSPSPVQSPARPGAEPFGPLSAGSGGAPQQASEGFPPPPAPSSGPGEFTRIFQAAAAGTAPSVPAAVPAAPASPPPPSDAGAGEFTRIFVSGKTSPPTPAPRADEISRPAPAAPVTPGRAKGFSSQGSYDSASGEGSFTQFFQSAGPAAPATSPSPRPPAPAEFSLSDQIARQNSPVAEPSGQSVTSLLSSLASSGGGSPSVPTDPAPYRPPSPAPFSSAPFPTPSPRPADPPIETGGVTRLIQKLTQEQASAAPAPPSIPVVSAPPPPSSGPGDFTRMISKLVDQNAPAAAAPPPPPAVAAPPAAAPPPFQVAVPPLRPPMPAAPAIPSIPTPALTPPPAPKLAPAPAPAAPKGKFEAIVPVLLVINTFLLLLILVVVLFLARAR